MCSQKLQNSDEPQSRNPKLKTAFDMSSWMNDIERAHRLSTLNLIKVEFIAIGYMMRSLNRPLNASASVDDI